jgi:hypothetical protein
LVQGFRLGIAGEDQLAVVGGRDMHIDPSICTAANFSILPGVKPWASARGRRPSPTSRQSARKAMKDVKICASMRTCSWLWMAVGNRVKLVTWKNLAQTCRMASPHRSVELSAAEGDGIRLSRPSAAEGGGRMPVFTRRCHRLTELIGVTLVCASILAGH